MLEAGPERLAAAMGERLGLLITAATDGMRLDLDSSLHS
jgi:hypothetical protein